MTSLMTPPIVNISFLGSNIPISPAFDVFVSELVGYARVFLGDQEFLIKGQLLKSKCLFQGYVKLASKLPW